jgi:hypothetical protein
MQEWKLTVSRVVIELVTFRLEGNDGCCPPQCGVLFCANNMNYDAPKHSAE